LLAGARHLVAVEGEPAQALVEGRLRRGDDVLVGGRPIGGRIAQFDDDRDLTELVVVYVLKRILVLSFQ
jgi:hypothetical protein